MHPSQEAPGIFRLPVHTPFRTESTNTYVLKGDQVCLVDTGVNTPRTWDELCAGLASLGLTPDDIETVVVSHAHIDHDGLAHRFSHAEVLVGAGDHHKLVDFPGHMRTLVEIVGVQMPLWGVPTALLDSLKNPLQDLLEMSASVPWAASLGDRTVLEGFGPPFRVLQLAGHTEGGIGLYREHDGVLLAGDHVLERITPNPGLVTEHGPVRSGLRDYVASLAMLEDLDVSVVLPGHGRAFPGLRARLESVRTHHKERLDEVERLVGEGGSLFEVMVAMFPGIDSMNGFLALTEVLGHIEMLVAAGRLEILPSDSEVVVYRKAG
ncbi:MAG: MBL fold metallo-hydrolase [Thermoleophilia bacterium]